ncbi:hypothetical protein [Rhizobium leguminosarum]
MLLFRSGEKRNKVLAEPIKKLAIVNARTGQLAIEGSPGVEKRPEKH